MFINKMKGNLICQQNIMALAKRCKFYPVWLRSSLYRNEQSFIHSNVLFEKQRRNLSNSQTFKHHFGHNCTGTFLVKSYTTFSQALYPRSLNISFLSNLFSNISRCYHSKSKFTMTNSDFASYVRSLVDEFDNLKTNTTNTDNKTTARQVQQRLLFLEPVVDIARNLEEKYNELKEIAELSTGEDNKEMISLIENDIKIMRDDIEEIEAELIDFLCGDEVADKNDIVLEVSAGVGGQEAMLFAAEIFNMYLGYARYKSWSVDSSENDTNEIGGTRKSSALISGENVYKQMKHEAGVHRVQRVPKTESKGRIHTSTITVSVLPQPEEIDVQFAQKDLKIEAMRASGPGGQGVNTTDSAVRITHLPSGTVVECQQERSQTQNKLVAMHRLKSKIYQGIVETMESERRATRKMQTGTRGRSEKIRTYNFPQGRISDHRIKGNISDVPRFLQGESSLEDLIDNLEEESKYEMLESMLDHYQENIKKIK